MVSGSGGRGLLESNASSASVALGTHVVLLSFCPARRLERLLLRMRCFYFALRAHLHLLYYFNHCRNSGNNSRPTAPKQRLTRYAVINGARAIGPGVDTYSNSFLFANSQHSLRGAGFAFALCVRGQVCLTAPNTLRDRRATDSQFGRQPIQMHSYSIRKLLTWL